jgi:hypothetical protein
MLDLAGVQEIRLKGGGTEPAGEYTFFYGKGKESHELGTEDNIDNVKASFYEELEHVFDEFP